MLFTTHATVGAAVGTATGNPYLGFLCGILSHHFLDMLPHFDQGSFHIKKAGPLYLGRGVEKLGEEGFNHRDWIILFIDWVVSAFIFGSFFFTTTQHEWLLILSGALGGLMPDIIDSSPLWSKKLRAKFLIIKKYHRFHEFFHWTVLSNNWVLGFSTQLVLVTPSILYLLKK